MTRWNAGRALIVVALQIGATSGCQPTEPNEDGGELPDAYESDDASASTGEDASPFGDGDLPGLG